MINAIVFAGGHTGRAQTATAMVRRADGTLIAQPDTIILPAEIVTVPERLIGPGFFNAPGWRAAPVGGGSTQTVVGLIWMRREPRRPRPHNPEFRPAPGKRFIRGGRAPLRQALYMRALVEVGSDAAMRARYKALPAAGKPSKVALAAIMRKLLVLANALLRDGWTWTPNLA